MEFGGLEPQLECQVCLSLVCEPITIPCGHTFCRSCLVHSLRRSKKQCVTCRSICNVDPIEASENIMLKNIAQMVNPTLYQTKSDELAIEKSTWNAVLPVFFYNVVMFPGEILSLHLFEPRYKLMMQRISATSRKFAYIYVSPNRPLQENIALVAHIREAEFFSDGRCLVEAVISFPRYSIQEIYEESGTQGLYLAHLAPFSDIPLTFSEPTINRNESTPQIEGSPHMEGSPQIEGSPPSPTKAEISLMLSSCYEICRTLDQGILNARAYEPLPAIPSLELNDITFANNVELLTLCIMGRCPTRCSGEKVQYLRSQDTLDRLRNCTIFLHSASSRTLEGFGGILRQSVGGLLGWMVHGATESRTVESEASDQDSTTESDH